MSDRIRSLIAQELSVTEDRVVPGARLSDLGADHIMVLCIVIEIEDQLRVFVDHGEAESLVTVADVIALVERKTEPARAAA